MNRGYVLAEGQTEETFVREILAPHYARMGLYLTPIIISTSSGYRGGVVSYAKVKPQIERLCKQDAGAFVTTMIDLYALPGDFPGKRDPEWAHQNDGHAKASLVEQAMALDIGLDAMRMSCPNFAGWLQRLDVLSMGVEVK